MTQNKASMLALATILSFLTMNQAKGQPVAWEPYGLFTDEPEEENTTIIDLTDPEIFENLEKTLLQPKELACTVNGTILCTNQGSGKGNEYECSRQYIELAVPRGQNPEEFVEKIYEELKTFSHFNEGNNTEATVKLSEGCAFFKLELLTANLASTYIVGNAEEVPVLLLNDPKNHSVIAQTGEGHMLEGVRFWRVKLIIDPISGNQHVQIITGARCRPVGKLNNFGGIVFGSEEMLLVWTQYLENIAEAHGQVTEVITEACDDNGNLVNPNVYQKIASELRALIDGK